jgi:hypothetical protein
LLNGYTHIYIIISSNNHGNNWDNRGKDFFDQIYGDSTQQKEQAMNNANPDLWYLVKQFYGDYVSDPTYLDYKDTELEVIVTLIQMDALPQVIY